MNVDAAIFASSRRMGIGAVILDHRGECMAGFSDHLPEVTTSELAEALAIRRATSFAHTQGHWFLIVASDCLSMIHRLNDPAMDRSDLGAVVADIKLMATSFQSCSFKHISRGLNSAAHQLARSSELSSFFSFHGVVPEFIRQYLCTDVKV
jgi:ribonuclease HI